MTPRWVAIVNPMAGGGRALRAWPRLASALAQEGVAVRLEVTGRAGEATALATRAVSEGTRHVLAVGGDGTLHEVLNGVLSTGERVTIGVAPLGTGNDWARGLGVPRDAPALARMVAAGRVRPLDAGRVTFRSPAGTERRYFANVAGVGYDAWVLERMSRRGPRTWSYLWAVATGLMRYEAPSFRVQTAAGVRAGRYFVALGMLGRYCGGGMQFAPEARLDDGLLDLVTVDHLGALAALARLPRVYAGRIARDPAARLSLERQVDIDTDPPGRVEADGQLLGSTPAAFTVLPGAIDALVP